MAILFASELFSSHRLVSFKGPDCEDFLHRLSSAQVRGLVSGRVTSGCFLTPQGRFRSYFQLARLAQNEFFFAIEDSPSQEWVKRHLEFIEQYTFAEKMEVAELKANVARALLESNEKLNLNPTQTDWIAPGSVVKIEGGWLIRTEDEPQLITFWSNELNPSETSAKLKEFLTQSGVEEVDSCDLTAWARYEATSLRPALGREILESTSPLEVGLRHAVADNKGCYPGQEVIEKVISLGSPAQRLCLLRAAGSLPSSTPCPVDESAGILTHVVSDQAGWLGLALLRRNHAHTSNHVRVGGTAARVEKSSAYET